MKKFVFLVFSSLFLAGCFTPSEAPEVEKTEEPVEIISVNVSDLDEEFSNNALRAIKKYEGKRLTVSAYLGSMIPQANSITILFDQKPIGSVVVCAISNTDSKNLELLNRGDSVVVTGNYLKYEAYVYLSECSIETAA